MLDTGNNLLSPRCDGETEAPGLIAVQKMQSHLDLRHRKIPVWQVAVMEVVFTKAQLPLRKISLQAMMRSFLTKCCLPESKALGWGLQMGWEV